MAKDKKTELGNDIESVEKTELAESKKAVYVLGGKIEDEVKFNLPDSDISRSLIKIKKVSGTPKKYPRKSGLATKEPIK